MKYEELRLICPCIAAMVAETQRIATIVTLDFTKWAQEVEAYAATVLSRFVGEAHEEIEPIFGALQSDLELSATILERVPSKARQCVISALRELDEAIPDLHRYGVEDTQPLEDIRTELETWLNEPGKGRPGGPAPAPI